MKTKNWLIAVAILLNAVSASAQDLFEKLADNEHITSVYISKTLLNMFPAMSDKIQVEGVDVENVIHKLEQIDIYTSDNKEAAQFIRTEAKKLQSQSKSYEVLMKVKDGSEDVIFYAEKEKDRFKSLVMFVDSIDECTLIRLMGSFTAEDVQKITKK
ncbi:MAG: DUF4252 domain-containing protein [Dysgonamonadaceae bacterium]|jgi:hypothetical protein|nr:DUF4252 domain-containing protein [Dysgonamonadaceae bacterium]